jgi:hypothetical protein
MSARKAILILSIIVFFSACNQLTPQSGAPALMDEGSPEFTATIVPTATHPALLPTATVVDLSTPTLNPYPISTVQPTDNGVADQQLNPLTGLAVSDPEILNRRPVMVKFANWPREERPQAGLSQADIVFEYYIGHQMNQFLALYYGGNVEVVGPVRSGQLVDAQLASFYQGFLVYGNAALAADEVIAEDLGSRALKFSDLPCPPLCGLDALSGDAFVDTAALTDYVKQIGLANERPDLDGIAFQEEPPRGDGSGEVLQVAYADFSIMQWRYDEDTKSYSLWTESEGEDGLTLAPMTDRNDSQMLRFENIVVLYATYKSYTDTLHDILLSDQTGYQGMLLFRDGETSFGNWRTPELDQPIRFETPAGEALPLKPGKTWVVIVGQSSITNQMGGGEWEIGFGE